MEHISDAICRLFSQPNVPDNVHDAFVAGADDAFARLFGSTYLKFSILENAIDTPPEHRSVIAAWLSEEHCKAYVVALSRIYDALVKQGVCVEVQGASKDVKCMRLGLL